MTYYYAYIDENSQVTWLGAMPSPLTAEGYIEITQDQYENGNLMGKYWNGSEFVDALIHYYAVLSDRDIVIDIIEYEGTLTGNTVVEITSLDMSLMGLWYDRNGDQTFKTPPIHAVSAYSTDQINYRDEDVWLSDKIDLLADRIEEVADTVPTETTDSAMTDAEILAAVKNVDGHNSGLDADTLDGKHASEFATSDHAHTDYADANHTHSGYAEANHTHSGYASSGHTHSEYASSSHSHSEYASSSHSHSNYLPIAGGNVTGDLEINGELDVWNETNFRSVVRTLGTQTLYNSGTQITLASNNLPTNICGSAINASKTISVSSDERLKENINPVNVDNMIDFIKDIKVRRFNYIGNDRECIGAIAQQLLEANPEVAKYLVSKDEEGYLSVKIADLVFPLIVTVQELIKKVEKIG